MSKTPSLNQLSDKLALAMNKLEDGELTVEQCLALSKMHDSIINGLKTQMQYATLTNQIPVIPMLNQNQDKLIEN